ncbi:unnamed protein product [Arctia plantaginis]|uniref:Uncharacterized protein n=1 Tax=Arctia plantaginis TaxID=874455 RepID=A0A8S0ZUX0_ARCPL|nr:unnamed protein product [Arctia plantaginis]
MLLGQHSSARLDSLARQRRGLVDGVRYLANSLFGVLDGRFAEQYQKDIRLLRDNQRHISSYWQNQTSIIKTQYFTVIANKMQSSELNVKPEVYAPVIPPINQIINIPIPHLVPLNECGKL